MAKFKDQDSDLTSFEKFEKELKSIIFGVLFVMLKDDEDSLFTQIFLTASDGMQNLILVFNNNVTFPWRNDTFVEYFIFSLQLLQIEFWSSKLTWYSYMAVFYFFILIIFLVILDIIYIGYSFSVKRFAVMWPLYALRSTCSLFVTVLFMPLIDLFMSMAQCQVENGELVHYAYNDVPCWKGMHILHGSLAIMMTGTFFIICNIVGLTFYESKNEPNDPSAKVNARGEVFQNVYKIVCIVLNTFFTAPEYQWMLAIVTAAGGFIVFYKGYSEQPYYNDTMNFVVNIVNGIFLWACTMLILVMLLQDTEFTGGVQLFFLGAPMVGAILFSVNNGRQKMLMKPIEQFESGDEWYSKIRQYISLIHLKDTSRGAALELKGFIYDHEETCDKKDCPLKLYKQNITGMIKDKKRKVGRNLGAENNNLLWSYANKLFQAGLSKFPNATLMRISYAIFLKENMGNKNMAINELFNAERSSPPFDEQFVIYRYRKLIEEESSEVQGDANSNSGAQSANLDVVSIIAYDNHLRQCKDQIERAAYLHMEFWNELQQRRPDLAKLSKTGSRINTTITDIEEHWTKLQKINPNNPKALRMYGDFLIEILNDREAGQELISRAKDNVAARTAAVPDFYGGSNSGSNAADLWMTTASSDGSPCVLASGEQNKLGEIVQVNMGMCRTFGFTKTEMIGKKVDMLMPPLYTKHHDGAVKLSLQQAEEGAQNEEKAGEKNVGGRLIMGRHKSGYLVPMWLETRIFFLVSQGSLLAATFKPEKKNHAICYLLLDTNHEVVGVSSLCVNVLKITNSTIRNFRICADILAPDLLDSTHVAQFRSKEGGILEFFIPDAERKEEKKAEPTGPRASKDEKAPSASGTAKMTGGPESTPTVKEEEEKEEEEVGEVVKPKANPSKISIKMNCHLTDVAFTNEPKSIGFIMRLDPVDERKIEMEGFKIPEIPKYPEFQIVFDPIKYRFLCAWSKEDAQKEKELLLLRYKTLSALWKQTSAIRPSGEDRDTGDKDPDMPTQEEEEMMRLKQRQTTIDFTKRERKNYGEGIKTKRLQNGVFIEVAEINKMAQRELEEQMRLEDEKRRGTDKDLMSADAVRESLKSRKGLIAVIKDRSDPPSIAKLKITGYIVLLILLAIGAIEFGVTTTSFEEINDNVNLVRSSYRRITLFMKISYYLTKGILANSKTTQQMIFPGNYSAYMGDCKYHIEKSLSELYEAQNNITLAKISVCKEQDNLLNQKAVSLEFKDATTTSNNGKKPSYYTLTEAVLQMTSSVFTVLNLPDLSYVISNDDIEFILHNVFKDVYDKIMISSNYYVIDLKERANYKHVIVMTLFIIAICLISLSVIVLFPLVSNVGKIRAQVLSLFLDIPLSDVRGLAKRCERFLASNNEERNADMLDSTDSQGKDNLLEEEEIEAAVGGGAPTKEARIDRGNRRRRFLNDKSSNKNFLLKIVIAMLILCAFYVTNYVMTRIYLEVIEDCSPELNATIVALPLDATVLSTIQAMIGLGRILPLTESGTFHQLANIDIDRMQQVNHQVQSLHLENKDAYPAKYVNAYQKIMIENLCNSADELGFNFECEEYIAGIARQGLQTVMVQYVEVIREMLRLYLEIKADAKKTQNEKVKAYQGLLRNNNSAYIEEAETIVNIIMEKSYGFLLDKMIEAYKEMLDNEITRRVILFIVMIVIILLGFMMMWMPFISKLSTEIWRTKCMLTIIPKEVIAQMKSVQKFLNDPNIFSSKGEAN